MEDLDDIASSSPVLARADALMHRRRPSGPGEFDDLPVLTEVVGGDEFPVLAQAAPEPEPPPAFDADQLNILADELAARVRARLGAELPSLVEAALSTALAGLTADLRQGIDETTQAALRDFIAERERLVKRQRR